MPEQEYWRWTEHRHTEESIDPKAAAILTAGIDVGHKVAVTAHMGNVAYRTGRKLYWDEASWQFRDDPEANRLKDGIQYREPWEKPGR